MLYEYSPKLKNFTGTIKIKIPDMDERLEIAEACEIEVTSDGKYSGTENPLFIVRKVFKYIKEMDLLKEVNLVYNKKTELKKPEDLMYSPEGTEVLATAVPFILNGISLGGK
jgi:hypothetical protein